MIDWTLAYRGNAEARQAYNIQNQKKQLKESDPLPDKVRDQFTQQYGSARGRGHEHAPEGHGTASRLRRCDGLPKPAAAAEGGHGRIAATRASLEKQADDLLDKVKDIKQKAAEKESKS